MRDVQISYLPPNREPTVTISAPKPAERVRKTVDIKWKGEDPDRDKLTYDVSLSSDGGSTWQELKADIEGDSYSWDTTTVAAGPSTGSGGPLPGDGGPSRPVPSAVEGAESRDGGQKAKDGAYLVRVVASDRRSNPGEARQDHAEQVVWVDNTPPAVLVLRHTVVVDAKGKVTLRGVAADELSPLQGVDYRVDDGAWRAAAVEGERIGKRQVSFTVETDELGQKAGIHPPGERRVQVRAFDQAGNSAEDEVRVKVEPGAAAGEAATEASPAPGM